MQTPSGQQIIAAAPQSAAAQPAQVSVAQPVVNGPAASTSVLTTTGQVAAATASRQSTVQLPTTTTVASGKPMVRVQPITQTSTAAVASVSTPTLSAAREQLAAVTKPSTSGHVAANTTMSTKTSMTTRIRSTRLLADQAKKSAFY